MDENQTSTLRPPPGFMTNPDPKNITAFMEEYFNGKSNDASQIESSTLQNIYNITTNNNPFASHDAAYDPTVSSTATMLQILKKRFEIDVQLAAAFEKFCLTNTNFPSVNATNLNASSTATSTTPMNPTVQHLNPFQTHQQEKEQEFRTTVNSSNGTLNGCPTKLSTNKPNTANSITSPHSEAPLNVSSRDSNILFDSSKSLSNQPSLFVTQESYQIANSLSDPAYRDFNDFNKEHLNQNSSNVHTTKFYDQKNQHLVITNTLDNQMKVHDKSTKNPIITPCNPTFRTGKDELTQPDKNDSNEKTFISETQFVMSQENIGNNCTKTVNNKEYIHPQFHDTNPFRIFADGNFTDKFKHKEKQSFETNVDHTKNDYKPPIPPRNPEFINKHLNLAAKNKTNLEQSALDNQQECPVTKVHYIGKPVMYDLKADETIEMNGNIDKKTSKLMNCSSTRGKKDYNTVDSSPNHVDTLFYLEKADFSQDHLNSFPSKRDSQPNTTELDATSTPHKKFATNQQQFSSPRIFSNNYRPPPPLYSDNNSPENRYNNKFPIVPRFTSPILSETSKTTIDEIQLPIDLKLNEISEEKLSSPSINNNALYTNNSKLKNLIEKQENSSNIEENNNSKSAWSVGLEEFHEVNQVTSSNPEITEKCKNKIKTESCADNVNDKGAQACKNLARRKNQTNSSDTSYSHNLQNLVNENNLLQKAYENSKIPSQGDRTVNNNNCKFSSHKPQKTTHNFISQSNYNQSQPQDFASSYACSQPQYATNYALQMQQYYTMNYPQVSQSTLQYSFGINGCYPSAPNWSGYQFPNPAFAYQYSNIPYHYYQHPKPWNWHKSNMFVPSQIPHRPMHETRTVKSQPNSKIDIDRQAVSSGLNYIQIPPKEHQENTDTINEQISNTVVQSTKHDTNSLDASELTDPLTCSTSSETQTHSQSNNTPNLKNCTLSTQSHELSLRTTCLNLSENEAKNSMRDDTTPITGLSGVQILPNKSSTKNFGESTNQYSNYSSQLTSPRVITKNFKPIEVNNQTIYLFNIENEGWLSTDEIALVFTPYENCDVVLRILDLLNIKVNFKEVDRAQSPDLFSQLDSTTLRLPRMSNLKKIKGVLHLTPLKSLLRLMVILNVVSEEEITVYSKQKQLSPGSKLQELVKLVKAFKSDDEYWVS